ncbi:MAG: response regulator transcription factor [Anaerolineae bacterium]|jgi:DNA-binding response OmpR family regulator
MEAATILVVDDEPAVCSFLRDMLVGDGGRVTTARNGEEALARIATHEFDLVLLDLKMPGMDGTTVLERVRERWPDTSVIVLTGHGSLETAVEALRHGALDYLFKPCGTAQLRESVQRALRERRRCVRQRQLLARLGQGRGDEMGHLGSLDPQSPWGDSSASDSDWSEGRFCQWAGLIVDLMRHTVTLDGHLLELTPTEFDLLAHLVSEAPRVVPPRELVRAAQGYECAPQEARELVRSHIYHIREKAQAAAGRRDVIHTVRGVGYTVRRTTETSTKP